MGTPKSSNFDINAQMPLDSKIWLTESQRLALPTVKKYKWMIVIDSETGQLNQLVSAPNVTPAIWKPILSNISQKEDIPEGVKQWEEDHATLQQDGTYLLGYQYGDIVWLKNGTDYILYICILSYEDEGMEYSPLTDITHWKQIGKDTLTHLQNTDIHLGKYTTTINLITGHPDMNRYNNVDKILDLELLDKYNVIIINTDIANLEINSLFYSYNYKSTIIFNTINQSVIINDINYNEGNIFIEGGNKQIIFTVPKSFISIDFINTTLSIVDYNKLGEDIPIIPEGILAWEAGHTYYNGEEYIDGYKYDDRVYHNISGKDRIFRCILTHTLPNAPTGLISDIYWKELSPSELTHNPNTDITLGSYQTDITIAVGSPDESRLDIINKTLDLADLSFYNIINITIDFDDTNIILNNIAIAPIETTVIFNIISNNTIFKINDKSIDSGNIHINGNNAIILNNGVNHLLFKRLATLNHYQLLHNENIDSLISDNKIYVSNTYGNNDTAIIGNPFRSYKTIEAAVSAATSGCTIYIFKDNYYPLSNLFKEYIDFYFEDNTNVYVNTNITLFNMSDENIPKYCPNIYGGGNFYFTNGHFIKYGYNASNLNNNLNINFNILKSTTAVFGSIFIWRNEITNIKFNSVYNCNISINNVTSLVFEGNYIYTYNLQISSNAMMNVNTIEGNSTNAILDVYKSSIININTINNYGSGYAIKCNSGYYGYNKGFIKIETIRCNKVSLMEGVEFKSTECDYCYIQEFSAIFDISLYGYIKSIINHSNGNVNCYADLEYLENNNIGTFNIYSHMVTFYDSRNWNINLGTCIMNGNINNKNRNINIYNGKLVINGDIYVNTINFINMLNDNSVLELNGKLEMLNSSVTGQIIYFSKGNIYLNSATLKTSNTDEQYPISCITSAKNIKVLSAGLNLNKETFLPRKKKIRVTIGGTVTSDENYTIALAGTPYSSGTGHTSIGTVVDALIVAIGAAYTTTDNATSLDIEDLLVSVDFTVSVNKLAGTGTINYSLIRHATFQITPTIGTNIIVDSDI